MSLGRGGALELAVFAGVAPVIHALPEEGILVLGRGLDCDVRIDHPSVSRRHAALHLGPRLSIEDLGSANGTSVVEVHRHARALSPEGETENLVQLSRQAGEIALGDGITLGNVLIVVRRAESALPGASARAGGDEKVIRDPAMRALYEQAERAAQGPISVLLLGETGVGKEVLARHVHASSPRAAGPFLALNCAAISESLLESELFGHEKGAFTGALQTRPGLFEAAEGGTVFLDEAGDLPPSTQVKLLRVIEDRRVLRVGGRSPRSIDVRFVAATNRDLEAEVARGAFREDLFFRLSGMTLTIPPLRERPSEIAPLAEVLLRAACRQIDRAPPKISAAALGLLEAYRWPGNVRELRNAVERAVVLCAGFELLPEHLPARVGDAAPAPAPRSPATSTAPPPPPPGEPDPIARLRSEMDALERKRIVDALDRCAGNQTRAAALLGISRRTLVSRLADYDLPRPRKRGG